MKVRSDAWSHEDDLLLAETVLRYIREGGTQLQAFEEVGDKLNRTSAACGFRWNAEVRRQYDQAIQIAKKQRKERKRALANSTPANGTIAKEMTANAHNTKEMTAKLSSVAPPVKEDNTAQYQIEAAREFVTASSSQTMFTNKNNLSIDDVISFLSTLKQQNNQGTQLKLENDRLRSENNDLKKKNEELQRKVQQLSKQHTTIQEDYQALVQIMDRARKMVMFEDTEDRTAPVFKMDKNGNLEKVAK